MTLGMRQTYMRALPSLKLMIVLPLLLLLTFTTTATSQQGRSTKRAELNPPQILDANNRTELADSVYIFFSPTCPVCKSSVASLKTILEGYNAAFVAVVDTASANAAEMEKFWKTHKIRMPIRWDSDALAQRFDATATPEVVVIHNGRKVYQGRIDSQYEALGKRRRVITQHDLRDVLSLLESGMVPSLRRTTPVGCLLERK